MGRRSAGLVDRRVLEDLFALPSGQGREEGDFGLGEALILAVGEDVPLPVRDDQVLVLSPCENRLVDVLGNKPEQGFAHLPNEAVVHPRVDVHALAVLAVAPRCPRHLLERANLVDVEVEVTVPVEVLGVTVHLAQQEFLESVRASSGFGHVAQVREDLVPLASDLGDQPALDRRGARVVTFVPVSRPSLDDRVRSVLDPLVRVVLEFLHVLLPDPAVAPGFRVAEVVPARVVSRLAESSGDALRGHACLPGEGYKCMSHLLFCVWTCSLS